jgi:hypothetical protein
MFPARKVGVGVALLGTEWFRLNLNLKIKFLEKQMNNSLVLKTFIQQLDECLEDILRAYPELPTADKRFLKCKMYFDALKKSNPKIMIISWKEHVNKKYRKQIDAGDVRFFVETDLEQIAKENAVEQYFTNEVENAINELRQTIRKMSPANIDASMKYIQNLCKLTDHYIV